MDQDKINRVWDTLEDPETGKTLELVRSQPAKKFYGRTPQSKGAQNLSQQMAMTPALQSGTVKPRFNFPKYGSNENEPSKERSAPRGLHQSLGSSRSTSRRVLIPRKQNRLLPIPTAKKLSFPDGTGNTSFSNSLNNSGSNSFANLDDKFKSVNLLGTNNVEHSTQTQIGFPNKGLTCYINATLQALFALPSFMNHLLSLDQRIKRWPSSEGLLRPLCKLARFKKAANPIKINFILTTFQKKLVELYPQFEGMHNQDAHEFLVNLCDAIDEQCKTYSETSLPCKERSDKINLDTAKLSSETLISNNFTFKIKETKKCCICDHKREEITSNYVFKLDIPPNESNSKHLSLETLITDSLNSNALLACSSCIDRKKSLGFQDVTDSSHQLCDIFVELPKYLIIYCPRIEIYSVPLENQGTESTVRFRKNKIPIEIPEILSMAPFIDIDIRNGTLSETVAQKNSCTKRKLVEHFHQLSPTKKAKSSVSFYSSINHQSSGASKISPIKIHRVTSSPVDGSKPSLSKRQFSYCATPEPSPIKLVADPSIPVDNAPQMGPWVDSSPKIESATWQTPEKLKNLTGADVENLSEADQISFALKESMKDHSVTNTSNKFENLADLTEEEQMSRAINASLMANSISEEQQILLAIEESLGTKNVTKGEDDFKENALPSKVSYLVSEMGDGTNESFKENGMVEGQGKLILRN